MGSCINIDIVSQINKIQFFIIFLNKISKNKKFLKKTKFYWFINITSILSRVIPLHIRLSPSLHLIGKAQLQVHSKTVNLSNWKRPFPLSPWGLLASLLFDDKLGKHIPTWHDMTWYEDNYKNQETCSRSTKPIIPKDNPIDTRKMNT